MRKYAHTQMSVCIDMLEMSIFIEKQVLNREGNKNSLLKNYKKYIKKCLRKVPYDLEGIQNEQNDIRFMDPFDHVLITVNQAETDNKFGIPFEKGPVKLRSNPKKLMLAIVGIRMSNINVGLIGIGKCGSILKQKLKKIQI